MTNGPFGDTAEAVLLPDKVDTDIIMIIAEMTAREKKKEDRGM